MMNALQKMIKFVFSNLHRQVVTIHNEHGISPTYLLLLIMSDCLVIGGWLASTLCVKYNWPAFFEYDLVSKRVVYQANAKHPFSFRLLEAAYYVFFARFFHLLYFNYSTVDRVVWSHLYDLVVRNREQVHLLIPRLKLPEVGRGGGEREWIVGRLRSAAGTFFRSSLPQLAVRQSARLRHYPHLEERLRLRCIRITCTFELLLTVTFVGRLISAYLLLYGAVRPQSPNSLQVAIAALRYLTKRHVAFYEYASILLVELLLSLVGRIYVVQYRRVNAQLKERVKAKLSIDGEGGGGGGGGHSNFHSLSISRATAAYREEHTRLTAFILRLNSSLVARVIACYLHFYLPYNAYAIVRLYFHQQSMSFGRVLKQYWWLCFMGSYLLVLTLVVASVNAKICSSGSTLGAIFARKGVLALRRREEAGRRRRHSKQVNWADNIESIWGREAFKLATYYEMVWRSEKELAFTAGQQNTPMNWKFICDLTFLFSTFVMYFGGKYIRKTYG